MIVSSPLPACYESIITHLTSRIGPQCTSTLSLHAEVRSILRTLYGACSLDDKSFLSVVAILEAVAVKLEARELPLQSAERQKGLCLSEAFKSSVARVVREDFFDLFEEKNSGRNPTFPAVAPAILFGRLLLTGFIPSDSKNDISGCVRKIAEDQKIVTMQHVDVFSHFLLNTADDGHEMAFEPKFYKELGEAVVRSFRRQGSAYIELRVVEKAEEAIAGIVCKPLSERVSGKGKYASAEMKRATVVATRCPNVDARVFEYLVRAGLGSSLLARGVAIVKGIFE